MGNITSTEVASVGCKRLKKRIYNFYRKDVCLYLQYCLLQSCRKIGRGSIRLYLQRFSRKLPLQATGLARAAPIKLPLYIHIHTEYVCACVRVCVIALVCVLTLSVLESHSGKARSNLLPGRS